MNTPTGQTFNVTSCRACPCLATDRGATDEQEEMPDEHTCKHPQGGEVGDLWRSVIDGTPPPPGCPLRQGALLVRLCPSVVTS